MFSFQDDAAYHDISTVKVIEELEMAGRGPGGGPGGVPPPGPHQGGGRVGRHMDLSDEEEEEDVSRAESFHSRRQVFCDQLLLLSFKIPKSLCIPICRRFIQILYYNI